jgi:hypothetical protein
LRRWKEHIGGGRVKREKEKKAASLCTDRESPIEEKEGGRERPYRGMTAKQARAGWRGGVREVGTESAKLDALFFV